MLNVGSKCHGSCACNTRSMVQSNIVTQHLFTCFLNYDPSQCVILRSRLDFGCPVPLIDPYRDTDATSAFISSDGRYTRAPWLCKQKRARFDITAISSNFQQVKLQSSESVKCYVETTMAIGFGVPFSSRQVGINLATFLHSNEERCLFQGLGSFLG